MPAAAWAALRVLTSLLVGLCAYHLASQEAFSEEMVRGKRVLVTGASTGIGEQMAYEFARMGARLMVTARTEEQLQKVVQACLRLGAGSARYAVSDMSNLTAAQELAEEARRRLGGLDYLVLNHVATKFSPFEGDMESVTHFLTVNFLSYVQLTAAAMDMLRDSRGGVVVVSSMSGRIPAPFSVPYAATKFALEGFYSSLRAELRLRKIRLDVTVAVLGYIDTDSAVQAVGGKISMRASPKEACAREIVQAGVMRRREVVYPYWLMKPALLVKDWAPELLEWLVGRSYKLENIL